MPIVGTKDIIWIVREMGMNKFKNLWQIAFDFTRSEPGHILKTEPVDFFVKDLRGSTQFDKSRHLVDGEAGAPGNPLLQ
ncbi:MAG: hypothetical protein WD490_05330 [Opitutales bacterium]